MKRILILSDTHGDIRAAIDCWEHSGHLDGIIHLGDKVKDADDLALISGLPLIKVRGNCDLWDSDAPETADFSVYQINIHCTHGHLSGVKAGYSELQSYASKIDCDILLFGHTHMQDYFWAGKMLCVNPGSISRPRGNLVYGYAIAEIAGDSVTFFMHDYYEKTTFSINYKKSSEKYL